MIEFINVSKSYDGKTNIIERLNLRINSGELVVLIGESGSGKTTTMKMINRVHEPTSGSILINGHDIMDANIIELRRNIGYVIQKVGLFPHMTIADNIELIPYLKKWDKEKRRKRAHELLEMVNLDPNIYLDRYPNELSGGQQQRVGVARALAVNPDIILMDEPFSALDPITREQLQEELLKLQDELHKTIVFVTHDMDEALKIGDKIAVMRDGNIVQFDTPENILKNPVDEFVENFVGKDRIWKSPELLYAEDIMVKRPATISLERTTAKALEIMKEKGVEYLPVVDKPGENPKKVLGFVKPRELRAKENAKMKEIMNTNFVTVGLKTNMVEVLNIMKDRKVKNIPVIDEAGYLKGLVTQTSILNLFTDAISVFDDSEGDD
ncbi:ABC transporter ATP-binding protein [Serpentinicella alkaliphila]|uniref:Quaternary amine transport ATP-binding protein n=1 Tax=Serpentinicella alkaliphila TaxID=1734049 RepID=A0A4R2TK46_9FIRM|nr:ABC transporter ATP-binding protein [Serpentinicella alkaliphila]QUH24731.1 ABC transporter ATP-binding protein [Serpentinicella alkaliphila]TCQ03721.1 osmoprotectant transport system ATP-binding protein [Serpentinicella alkaliphila]